MIDIQYELVKDSKYGKNSHDIPMNNWPIYQLTGVQWKLYKRRTLKKVSSNFLWKCFKMLNAHF